MTYFKERSGCRRPFRRPMFLTTTGTGWDIAMRRHDADDRPYARCRRMLMPANGRAMSRACFPAAVGASLAAAPRRRRRVPAGNGGLRFLVSPAAQPDRRGGERRHLWEETSIDALHGLLEYLHGEVSDNLQDRRCAEQLRALHRPSERGVPELIYGTPTARPNSRRLGAPMRLLPLGGDLLDQFHQRAADVRVVDAGKRLHEPKQFGLRQLIEHGAARRVVHAIGPLEEIGDLHA